MAGMRCKSPSRRCPNTLLVEGRDGASATDVVGKHWGHIRKQMAEGEVHIGHRIDADADFHGLGVAFRQHRRFCAQRSSSCKGRRRELRIAQQLVWAK